MRGFATIYCLPEAGETFHKTLDALVQRGAGSSSSALIPTTIIDTSLYKVVAL